MDANLEKGGDFVDFFIKVTKISFLPIGGIFFDLNMFCTIINDCQDENAFGRQATKSASLFNCPIVTVGVKSDLEAAGNLIDILDAGEGKEGIILVNVAPRHGDAKRWPNGTPFGYFLYKETLVVSSIDGLTLSLVKKLGLTEEVKLFDIPEVLQFLKDKEIISQYGVKHISRTQFRSLEFLPRVAKWIKDGLDLPTTNYPISEIAGTPNAVWWVDNFGNCKTTLIAEDVDFEKGKIIKFEFGELECFDRLSDVPNETPALIIGSSGLEDKKFLEIIVQGKSAQQVFTLTSGALLTYLS